MQHDSSRNRLVDILPRWDTNVGAEEAGHCVFPECVDALEMAYQKEKEKGIDCYDC